MVWSNPIQSQFVPPQASLESFKQKGRLVTATTWSGGIGVTNTSKITVNTDTYSSDVIQNEESFDIGSDGSTGDCGPFCLERNRSCTKVSTRHKL